MIEYKCNKCRYKFKNKSNLTRHLKNNNCINVNILENKDNIIVQNKNEIQNIDKLSNIENISLYIDKLYSDFIDNFKVKTLTSSYMKIYNEKIFNDNISNWLLEEIITTFSLKSKICEKNVNIKNKISSTTVKTISGFINYVINNIVTKVEKYYNISALIQNCINIEYIKIDENINLNENRNSGEYSFIIELCDNDMYNSNGLYFPSTIDEIYYMKKGDIIIFPSSFNYIYMPMLKGNNYIIYGNISINEKK